MANYFVSGYTPPKGVDSKQKVKQIQATLGVKQDGIWGVRTQAAWDAQSTGKLAMPEAVPLAQASRPQADYAISGYTPPTGVTDRQMVRSIQANLGVARDGIWGPKTQAAWEKQYGGLWQERANAVQTTSKAYAPPKGIDSAEELRQVQQRLRVKADGIWGRETQEAWDKMRAPQTVYQPSKRASEEDIMSKVRRIGAEATDALDRSTQSTWNSVRSPHPPHQAPKGIDSEQEIRQVQQRLRVKESGIWDSKTQEAWDKMRDPKQGLWALSFSGIKEYYDEQISGLHEKVLSLGDLESRASGPLKESIRKEIISTQEKLQNLIQNRDSGRAKQGLINHLERESPFYSSKRQEVWNSIADIGRKLWYNNADIGAREFYRLIQIGDVFVPGGSPLKNLLVNKQFNKGSKYLHYFSNKEALEKHKSGAWCFSLWETRIHFLLRITFLITATR